jgi:hypothetical protein
MHESAREVIVRMQCPYCLEEVKEEAVACGHCGRDLSAFKLIAPTLEKVASLEKRLSSLEQRSSPPETRAPDTGPSQANQNSQEHAHGLEADFEELHIWFWFSALFCAAIPVIAYLLLTSVPSLASIDTFWVSLVILMLPLAVGFEAGYFWSGRHWRDYLIAGAFVGSFAAFELWIVFNAEAENPQGWTKLDWAAGASGIAVGALFLSGVLFGDIYEARTSATRTKSPAAAFAAATVFSSGAKGQSVRTSMLIQLLETLGPAAIGAIGTIITALLSVYFARTS